MEGLVGSLGIDGPTLIAQLINFVVLFALLYVVAYKPLMKMLDERSGRVKESIEQTEHIKEKAAKADEDAAKHIEEASKEGQKMLKQAMEAGEEVRLKAQEEAKEEAGALIDKARTEIKHERDEAVEELRKEVADLAIMAAGKVVGRSLDKEAHIKLIDEVLDEAPGLKKG